MALFGGSVICPDCRNPLTESTRPRFEYEIPALVCEPCERADARERAEAKAKMSEPL